MRDGNPRGTDYANEFGDGTVISRQRRINFGIEILIALLFVAFIGIYVHLKPGDLKSNWPWIPFLAYTAIVFAVPVYRFRTAWQTWSFWLTLSISFVLHVLAFVLLKGNTHQLWGGYYPLLAPFEAEAIVLIIKRLFPSFERPARP
jgi:hypothetical protein